MNELKINLFKFIDNKLYYDCPLQTSNIENHKFLLFRYVFSKHYSVVFFFLFIWFIFLISIIKILNKNITLKNNLFDIWTIKQFIYQYI